jgi:hypothetical protein
MHILLLVVGVIVTAVGAAMAGFGIPINDFSLGNTLIIAGTTAIAGGLLLIAAAAIVLELKRITQRLHAGSSAIAGTRLAAKRADLAAADVVEPVTATVARPASAPSRVASPPRSEGSGREPRPAEQRFAPAAPSIEAPEPLEWLRPKGTRAAPKEAHVSKDTEDHDDVPLSPRGPRMGPPSPAPEAEAGQPSPRSWSPGWSEDPGRTQKPESAHTTVSAERPARGLFDNVWPGDRKSSPVSPDAAVQVDHKEDTVEDKRNEAPQPAPSSERRPVAILKSGVIDGMAYTLYTDGSIEAELPQGAVRFDSIHELRVHLESSGQRND